MKQIDLKLKRAYQEPEKSDGKRILVDRLWPRGLTREKATIDLWLKEVAPSTELREWFAHDRRKWRMFCGRYETELKHRSAELDVLRAAIKEGQVTLIYGARDQEHNEAVVLKRFIEKALAT
jgi:uncharacterized protein YeaO (DUF488 family)